jgi:hypothetical protein
MDLLRLNQWVLRESDVFQDSCYALFTPKGRENLSYDGMAQDQAYCTFVAFILGSNGKLTVIAQWQFKVGEGKTIPGRILQKDG